MCIFQPDFGKIKTKTEKGDTMQYNFRRFLAAATVILIIAIAAIPVVSARNSVPTLSRYGSTGTEVKNIQNVLKRLGYYTGAVDGIYGSGTKNAVLRFQRDCGLTQDGICGPVTLLYLGLDSGGSTSASGKYSSSDVALLAKVISAEARGEPYEGQVAVGAVVLNRVAHPSFPNSVSGVVYQSGAFSAVTDSNWSAAVTDSAKRAAQDAINGWDPSGGAIYYYNPKKTSNQWIRTRKVITVIGNHYFAK
ncbi:MAG: spore cortex-lytic enzyme [Clostridia bacterium]|nr:spore cortex-lytic enzyme [Clostridia bacterium]